MPLRRCPRHRLPSPRAPVTGSGARPWPALIAPGRPVPVPARPASAARGGRPRRIPARRFRGAAPRSAPAAVRSSTPFHQARRGSAHPAHAARDREACRAGSRLATRRGASWYPDIDGGIERGSLPRSTPYKARGLQLPWDVAGRKSPSCLPVRAGASPPRSRRAGLRGRAAAPGVSPEVSMDSSVAKPGPSVAISKRIPPGSRK